jgi:hypothetical protein
MPNYLSLYTIYFGNLIMHFKAGSIDFMYTTTVNNGYAGITCAIAESAKLYKPELMW